MLCRLRLLQVPGTYFDALNGNTKLGKAVKAAVAELEHLGELVRGVGRRGRRTEEASGKHGSSLDAAAACTTWPVCVAPCPRSIADPLGASP